MLLYCLIAVIALFLGGVIGWFAGRNKPQAMLAASEAARRSEAESAARQQEMLVQQIGEQKKLLSAQMAEQERLQREAAQKQFENLKNEFKLLAEKVLVERSEAFEKNGRTQLDAMLSPLKTKLDEFKNNAEITRKQTLETNARLSEQIQLLMKSSRELGEEANQLARALRSDNKLQGNWGEMILDEILVSSGLQENVHYQKQATLTDDSGNTLYNEDTSHAMRPDVMVNYPDGKVVIIDSKVSLANYIDYVNSEDDAGRENALKAHIRSVKNHVDELFRKNYSSYVKKAKKEAVEFVIMFLPSEGAYELAMRHDVKLWQEAFSRRVLIVSPVNLMALLQLINLSWRKFDQERNQQAIIDTASVLLDRLYAFYQQFDEVGLRLENAMDSFHKAADRLRGTGGKHSVVKKGEELKALGVKMKKKAALPVSLQPDDMPLEIATESDAEDAGA